MNENHFDAPFPQADDFEKVVTIINIEDASSLKDVDKMCILLGDITSRQVVYYTSACIYLGILNKDKSFTALGNRLRAMNSYEQVVELSRIIISDAVFGFVYFQQEFTGIILSKEDIVAIMKRFISFDSEPMYQRRASTIISWIRWINNHKI